MNEKCKVLLVDDDVTLRDAVAFFLTKNGYKVTVAGDGREALQKLYSQRPDLIILDIMMPNMDGWEACSRIREISDVPMIMLTARGQEYDKVKGLKMGADDYLVKPFSLRELEARIEAVLRRARTAVGVEQGGLLYHDDELTVDSERWQVSRRGAAVELTATERRLLFFLAENADRVLPTSRIMESVWGPEFADQSDYAKLYIWRLRQKIEPNPEKPIYILTERGVGYRFARQTEKERVVRET